MAMPETPLDGYARQAFEMARLAEREPLLQRRDLYLQAASKFASLGARGFREALSDVRELLAKSRPG